jgi:hypothetical protein
MLPSVLSCGEIRRGRLQYRLTWKPKCAALLLVLLLLGPSHQLLLLWQRQQPLAA